MKAIEDDAYDSKELSNAVKLLEHFLKLVDFKNREKLTLENKKYLAGYCILKQNANSILVAIHAHDENGKQYTYTNFLMDNEIINEANDCFKRFRNLYNDKRKAGFKSFKDFISWWCSNENKCYYCKTDQATCYKADEGSIMLTSSKFYPTLQIDRKNPKGNYDAENCVLACPICNNAKSDMIKAEDFQKYFGSAIHEYWKYSAGEIINEHTKG